MIFKNYSFIAIVYASTLLQLSCGNNEKEVTHKTNFETKEGKDKLIEANKIYVKKESDEIDQYIKHKKWEMITTGSGLRYMITQKGTGAIPKTEQQERLNFNVKLLDGTLCYSSDSTGAQMPKRSVPLARLPQRQSQAVFQFHGAKHAHVIAGGELRERRLRSAFGGEHECRLPDVRAATEQRQQLRACRGVRRRRDRQRILNQAVTHVSLFDERQHQRRPTPARLSAGQRQIRGGIEPHPTRWHGLMCVVIKMQREPQLFQIVDTRGASSRLARGLHGGEQQGRQNPNDGDHHQ